MALKSVALVLGAALAAAGSLAPGCTVTEGAPEESCLLQARAGPQERRRGEDAWEDEASPGTLGYAEGPSRRTPSEMALVELLPARGGNPFTGQKFYVNPQNVNNYNSSIATTTNATVKANLQKMQVAPTAFWVDMKSKIRGSSTTTTMEGILAASKAKATPELVVFILYDLPNRDCAAGASGGEICCVYAANGRCNLTAATATGTCSAGIADYQTNFIDPIVAVLKIYDGIVPIALVIEPDSLPNLVTNRADIRCGGTATVNAYSQGIKYAVNKIGNNTKSVAMYLDAGHSGWLGWTGNMQGFVNNVSSLGVWQYLRGFATNVAGYQVLGTKICPSVGYCMNGAGGNAHPTDPCCVDPCGLVSQWNPSQTELNYALQLQTAMSQGIKGFFPRMVIDTSRNGVGNARSSCGNWCNIRRAGAGFTATTSTANTTIIDAYFWLKPPGASDGCTSTLPDGTVCPSYDANCGSVDAIGSQSGEPRAPVAGAWFDYEVKLLAANAQLR